MPCGQLLQYPHYLTQTESHSLTLCLCPALLHTFPLQILSTGWRGVECPPPVPHVPCHRQGDETLHARTGEEDHIHQVHNRTVNIVQYELQ